MEKNYRKLWIEALRSGKYVQGKGALQRDGKFCCLGVACEVLIENGVHLERTLCGSPDSPIAYNHATGSIPSDFAALFGDPDQSALINMNDIHNNTFSEIADYLEKE